MHNNKFQVQLGQFFVHVQKYLVFHAKMCALRYFYMYRFGVGSLLEKGYFFVALVRRNLHKNLHKKPTQKFLKSSKKANALFETYPKNKFY